MIDLKRWDVKDGLPHRAVNAICKDRQGFIWIGTPYGLSRFDGYRFTNYAGLQNIIFNKVINIAEDSDGDLWLVTQNLNGYFYYIFNPVTLEISPIEKKLGRVPDHTHLWSFFKMADSSILASRIDGERRLYYTWRPSTGLREFKLPPDCFIITEIPQRNCLLVENDARNLMEIDHTGKILRSVKAPFKKGSVRIGWYKTTGVYIRDDDSHNRYHVSPDLVIKNTEELLPENEQTNEDVFDVTDDGVIWVHSKLYKPGTGILHDFTALPGFDKGAIPVIYESGNIWMLNEFGLYLLNVHKNKFRQYFNDDSKSGYINTCRGITKWNRNIYVGTEFAGLFRINEVTGRSELAKGCFCYGIKKVSSGVLFGGVCLLDSNRKTTCYSMPDDNHINCWSFYEFTPERCLLGRTEGLSWFNERTGSFTLFNHYNNFPELAKTSVQFLGQDHHGQLWACSNSGLYSLDTGSGITARYSSADSGTHYLPATDFRHFYQDAGGIFWLATTTGLIRWDQEKHKFRQYLQADGLSNNNIYGIYGDHYDNVWMSSDYGIMKLNKTSGVVKTYTTDDGVSNNEFNRTSHYQDDSGNIYFGSLCGVNVINPTAFIADESSAQPLAITSFMQFDGETNKLEDKRTALLQNGTITLYPQDRFFTLEFALLNYSNPEQTLYYWKIDGVDTGWNIQKDRTIRLSRLPYDKHILRIKAQAANGSWSKNEIVLNINVLRPFYLQLWFLIFSVIAAVTLVISGYRWRLYLLRRENERLDKTVKEKTEDLRVSLHQKEILLKEIHHRVKNNLQVISSLLRLQSHSVKDEAAKSALLEGQNRVLSIALIHQKLYQDEQLDTVEFATFADELFSQLNGVFRKPDVDVNFINEVPEMFLGIDIAVPLGLILNELITNSFKYAFKDSVKPAITLKFKKDGQSILTYSDNGPGLPGDINFERSKTLGLKLVSRLSKQLHGSASYIKNEFVIYFNENEAANY